MVPSGEVGDAGFGRFGARERRDDAAAEQDEDAVAEREQLGDLGRGHEHADPALGRLEQQPVDLGLRADVDAAGRLVEHHHLRARGRATSRAPPSAGCRPRASRRARRGECGADRAGPRSSAATVAPSRPARGGVSRPTREVDAIIRFSSTLICRTSPCRLRSAGTKATPSRDRVLRAAEGDRRGRRPRRALRLVQAEDGLEQLAAARTDEPRKADDLARRHLEVETSRARPGATAARRCSTGLAVGARAPAASKSRRARGRPSARSAAAGRTRPTGPPPTVCPSRRTVMRSASSKISLSRCETKITATPSARRRRTTPKSDSTSSSVSELVGSSRIRTRASIESARAISTICCWSGRRRRTGQRRVEVEVEPGERFAGTPARRRASRSGRRARPCGGRGRCSRRSRGRERASSPGVTVAMPWRSASVGLRKLVGLPPSVIAPLSGCTCPERIFSSVDLPEPFSPSSACTSPG